jgi:hypothetical protein
MSGLLKWGHYEAQWLRNGERGEVEDLVIKKVPIDKKSMICSLSNANFMLFSSSRWCYR